MAKKDNHIQRAKKYLGDPLWRINNLYWIRDKAGNKVKFKLNWAQEQLYHNMHNCNIILKARQLGMSTFICILFLDRILFNSDTAAGLIAHTRDDAEQLFKRIKYAFDNLSEPMRNHFAPNTDSAKELVFSNGSSIRVGTSLRSATLQYLHISELGKIAAMYPEKAREIRTGALNTVQAGQHIFIESTAEGQSGEFYDMCQESQKIQAMGQMLTPLDFKFFFFPWWKCTEYEFEYSVQINADMQAYFEELEHKHGIVLSLPQKNWYVRKANQQRDDMFREYPSTPEEAFLVANEGKYYSKQFVDLRKKGRITSVPCDPCLDVHVSFDLGIGDNTSLWFWQQTPGGEIHVIDFYENSGEALQHYVALLKEKGYLYGSYFFPHDIEVREFTSGVKRIDTLRQLGIHPTVLPKLPVDDGIQAVRSTLPRCWFDEGKCSKGIEHLENYRKSYSKQLGCFLDKPLHDSASDASDSFRYACIGMKQVGRGGMTEADAERMAQQYGRII